MLLELPVEVLRDSVCGFLGDMDRFCLAATCKSLIKVRSTNRPYMHATVFSGNCYLCTNPLGITYIQKVLSVHAPKVYVLVCPECTCHRPIYDIPLDIKVDNMRILRKNNLAKSDSQTDLTIGWNAVRKKKLVNRILDRTKDVQKTDQLMGRQNWSGNFFRDVVSLLNT